MKTKCRLCHPTTPITISVLFFAQTTKSLRSLHTSSCTDTRINSRNLSNYPNLLWCIFDLECLRRQAWNNQKMAGSLASLLVLVTAMKGASSAETTVQYVKHLKTTQQKEAWPKMVYQSVSFNAPPSVCQLCSFCSIELFIEVSSLLRKLNVRRFA